MCKRGGCQNSENNQWEGGARTVRTILERKRGDGEINRQTVRQTDRQQTDRDQRHRQTDRQTDRQTGHYKKPVR